MPIKILSREECLKRKQEEAQNLLSELLVRNNIAPTDSQSAIFHKLADSAKVLEILDKYWTADPFMLSQKEMIRILAPHEDEVLITGPTGTGKEIFAQALAAARTGPFIPINCAALNETLVESELFGHTKGAYTDAKEAKMGVLQAAINGTIFLDDIDKMPQRIQPKLLRAIQEKEVRPLGSVQHQEISCRFICASKRPVDELLNTHGFLEDLYARISTFEVKTTALSERPGDIKLILTKLGIPEKYHELDANWLTKIQRTNVRGLLHYAAHYRVFIKSGWIK